MAMHVAVGLLKLGQRVSTIDLDSTQQSLTRYIENRRIWANYRRIELELPAHRYVSRARRPRPVENEAEELAALETAISSFDRSTDFLVIDTPSNDTYLMRLAHLMADMVLTPLSIGKRLAAGGQERGSFLVGVPRHGVHHAQPVTAAIAPGKAAHAARQRTRNSVKYS
jgi:cellulose biosynthesis protein BcsQ